MTSQDGLTFYLHVKTEDGADRLLGFPHREISPIMENAAMQSGHVKDEQGELTSAIARRRGAWTPGEDHVRL